MIPSSPTTPNRDSSFSRRLNNLSWSQWLWHRTFDDCCNFTRHYNNNKVVSLHDFLIFVVSKIILEVCGAAGAVWGICEIINWRHVENTDDFHEIVTITFVIFAIRFYWHAKHFWQYGYDFPYVKLHHRRSHWYHGLQVFGAKFLLQVCGAAGAVWGASETAGFRHALNRHPWQIAAWVTTVLFGIRWLIELVSYCLLCRRRQGGRCYNVLKNQIIPFLEVTVTKFVLEVCGSTGAVWAVADILSIRDQTPDSATTWRMVALVIGSIFFLRWALHVKEYLHRGDESPLVTEPPSVELLQQTSSSFETEEDEETSIITDQGNYGSTLSMTPSDDHEIV